MKAVRILLADDHALVREGIRALLEAMPGVKVVGEVADGAEALQAIDRLHPDILLLDITMAGLNGLETTVRMTREHPSVKVLILSMHRHEEYVQRALRAGAAGYLVKDAAAAELRVAISTVARGDRYLCPAIAQTLAVAQLSPHSGAAVGAARSLTPRQREILTLVALGLSSKEIAFRLKRSVKTVETHRARLMERLAIYDVPGLVKYAIRAGFIPPVD